MSLMKVTSDAPKDRVSVLKYRKQIAEDANKLSKKAFIEKYNALDDEDRKAFFPNRTFTPDDLFQYYKGSDPAVFDRQIANEEKRIKIRKDEDDRLTQSAMGVVGQIKPAVQGMTSIRSIKSGAKEKFGYEPGETVDPEEVVKQGMIEEAKKRIAEGRGIGLSQEPKSDMTCIAGVCTLAANQGVDFSKMKGMTGVVPDEEGRYIPQFNPSFTAAKERSGYVELPKGERPKKGDLVQYFAPRGPLNELVPGHMEMILEEPTQTPGRGETYQSFNNYALYAKNLRGFAMDNAGLETRSLTQKPDGTFASNSWDQVRFYRLSPEAAQKAVEKNRPDIVKKGEGKRMFEQSEDFKRLQQSEGAVQALRSSNLLGDDQSLAMEIAEGFDRGLGADDLKKTVLTKAKNQRLVERVIDLMYK